MWTSSLDRTLVLYDPRAGKQCLRLTLPQGLSAMAMNATGDILTAGSTEGPIYIIDLNETARNFSVANSQRQQQQQQQQQLLSRNMSSSSGGSGSSSSSSGINSSRFAAGAESDGQLLGGSAHPAHGNQVLVGHQKSITGLCFSRGLSAQDASCLISSSLDGYVRVWNIWSRQCISLFQPLSKCAITSIMVRLI